MSVGRSHLRAPRRRRPGFAAASLGSARAASSRGAADNDNERLRRETVLLFSAFWRKARRVFIWRIFWRLSNPVVCSVYHPSMMRGMNVVSDDAAYFVIRYLERKLYVSAYIRRIEMQ